jgi:uncharacterized protein YhaN
MKHFILFSLLFLVLVACDKPKADPESGDPIYNDLLTEANAVNSQISAAEKELEEFQKALEAVVPQTGQIKYASKRVSETTARIDKLKQMKQYWEMRAESRKEWDRKAYLVAYKAKKPWPDPNEYEQYKLQRKLEQAPRNWDIRERLEQAKIGIPVDPTKHGSSGEHGGEGEQSEHGSGGAEHGAASDHGKSKEH